MNSPASPFYTGVVLPTLLQSYNYNIKTTLLFYLYIILNGSVSAAVLSSDGKSRHVLNYTGRKGLFATKLNINKQ